MMASRAEGESRTLMDCKCNVWSGVATQVEKHPNDNSIIEVTECWNTVDILWKRSCLGRC